MSSRSIVICGPSGCGKTTILKRLFNKYPGCFGVCVSHTTRKPRLGELDGKEYYFVSREEILRGIQNNEFLESAEFSGNIYGTSKKAVRDMQETGRICIFDVDIRGVRSIKNSGLGAVYIRMVPPSLAVLESRLRGRGTETEESLQKRLKQAVDDMAEIELDPDPTFFDHVIVNEDLDEACRKFESVLCGVCICSR